MTQDSQTKNSSDHGLYFMVVCFTALIIVKKINDIKPVVELRAQTHIVTLSGVGTSVGALLLLITYAAIQLLKERNEKLRYLKSVTSEQPGSVFAGHDGSGKRVFIPIEARRMHTELIGTTNSGKSESVIIPWAVADVRSHRGFIIVDGKADSSFIAKLYGYVKRFKRVNDFKVLSLQDPSRSHTFNPLLGGTPEEVAERVFNSFEFDNSYYESVQYEIFSQVLRFFIRRA